MYLSNYRLRKTLLDKCPKSPIWGDPSTTNIGNALKHCWNLNGSTFTIFIDYCEGNSVGKGFSWWYAKSWDCLLTHWLPIASILFLIETIYSNIFRCNYLKKKKKTFLNFFLHFRNLDLILDIFRKKMTLIADVFSILRTPKYLVRWMSKKSRFSGPFNK